ncbi:DUF4928 family protein [Solidesulfovibrio sp. C21]|uniref:DUF4928 family protein n=1 Tax=Solidesulfovibrio sp. C21 TaxID=3398613 RepID=UPI0039FC7FFC
MDILEEKLRQFQKLHRLYGKGQLALALYVTRIAIHKGLPLDSETLVTRGTGQVAGLSKSAVQSILADYGITRVLAEECGRTSRGSLGHMRNYVAWLNSINAGGLIELAHIESWWISRVKEYFQGKPFVLRYDAAKSLRSIVTDVLEQAIKRQKENPGATFAGTVLQHLVGAKLDIILQGEKEIRHYGASVADAANSRPGDFVVDDVAIHVTTSPTEALIRKCKSNLDQGLSPIIITISESRAGMESLARNVSLQSRIDIIEAEQFIATNLHEWTRFDSKRRRFEISKLFDRYNAIIEEVETDPSLMVMIP